MTKFNYIISKHAKERIKERGINQTQFIKRDLSYNNVRNMITTKDNCQIRYTRNNLKIILRGNIVLTVYKIRAIDIKRDMQRYKS